MTTRELWELKAEGFRARCLVPRFPARLCSVRCFAQSVLGAAFLKSSIALIESSSKWGSNNERHYPFNYLEENRKKSLALFYFLEK